MAYIGKTPITGNFVKLDAISVVNGQAGYTMNNGGSAFTDYENVNQFLVSLNGILQAPTDSFTVSGSTITFASNLSTGDVIDFIIVLGNTLDIGTPSDATVTQAKTNFVSTSSAAGLQIKGDGTTDGTLQLNCSQNSHGIKLKSPSHSSAQSYTLTFPTTSPATDKFLKTDSSGNLSFADAGGMVKLLSQTASGASTVTFDSTYITSTYKVYELHCTAVDISSDAGNLGIQTSTDNGSSYETGSNYKYIKKYSRDDITTHTINSAHGTGDDRARIFGTGYGMGTNNNEGGQSIVTIFDPSGTGKGKFIKTFGCHFDENNKLVVQDHTYALDQSAAINNFKIIPASGTFSGVFTLYGIT